MANAAAEMTATQARRAAAHVSGDSLATIAAAEGVTKQAVAKSLDSPRVLKAFEEMILGRVMHMKDPETGKPTSILNRALETVADCAFNAKRPVVITTTFGGSTTQEIRYVTDYQPRLQAALRLIDLIDKPKPAAVEELRESETITRTRERRRVDAG